MNRQPEQPDGEPDSLDRLLAEARWAEPKPEAIRRLRAQWQLLMAGPQQTTALTRRRRMMSRIVIIAVAAVVLVCLWLGVSHFTTNRPGDEAFAQTFDQLEKVKTVTWKTTYYERITGKDGKRTWRKAATEQCAYKSPGLYRTVRLGENGQIESVVIADVRSKQPKELTLYPAKKEASLQELAVVRYGPLGPFEWVMKELKEANVQWAEKRKTTAGEVNVFRHAFRDHSAGADWSYDFWIDQKTKRLVELRVPGADIFDLEKEWSIGTVGGFIQHDIVFDADLDDSQFQLEPPAGYAIKTERRPQVTEKEMIDYLGILADYNDKTFPDQVAPFPFSSDRTNKIWDKPKKDRTAAEQKLLDTYAHYIQANLNSMPTGHFQTDHTVKDTFRFLGKGVKLGDKDRIVCWYKLKAAKDPKSYRVLYGDLSVRDVAPEALPLGVQP